MRRTCMIAMALSLGTALPALAQDGVITGPLSYPSDGIPPEIRICAEAVGSDKITCTDKHFDDSASPSGKAYRLDVAAGRYKVFSVLPEGTEFDPSSSAHYRAYYSDFVTCGLEASCKSHQPIEVEVAPGATVVNIGPNDWYAPN